MTTEEYERLAMRTEADQDKILVRLMNMGANAMRLDNAARGLCGDAGEVATAVMKYIEYGKELDLVNLKEEVGDCLWRLAQVCKAGGFTMKSAMQANIRKLQVRYPDKYTDDLAGNRDRKAEADAIIQEHRDAAPYGRDYLGEPRKVPNPNDLAAVERYNDDQLRDPATGNLKGDPNLRRFTEGPPQHPPAVNTAARMILDTHGRIETLNIAVNDCQCGKGRAPRYCNDCLARVREIIHLKQNLRILQDQLDSQNATTLPMSEWKGRKPGEESQLTPVPKEVGEGFMAAGDNVVQDGHGFGHVDVPDEGTKENPAGPVKD